MYCIPQMQSSMYTRIRVDAVNVQKNIVKIGGVWVDPTPLTEIA